MTRVLVTGCRHWEPGALVQDVADRLVRVYGDDLVVVHGDCPTGIDALFRLACHALGVKQELHPANWKKYGKAAGPIRNAEMVKAGAKLCLAFHRDLANSAGTGGCVRLAREAGIPVWHYHTEAGPNNYRKII